MSLLVHVSIRGPTVLSIWQWSRLLRRLLELLLEPALAYVLLRAPVEERYRAHSLLDVSDLQSGPVHACLLPHQLSDALPLLFFAQVSRDCLLFCQLPNILRHQDRGCADLPSTRVRRTSENSPSRHFVEYLEGVSYRRYWEL